MQRKHRQARLFGAFLLSVGLALALAPAAGAEIYRWKDASGREHFTTDLSAVPPADRARAQAAAGASSGGGVNRFSAPEDAPPARAPEASRASSRPAAQADGAEKVGGHEEAWWREQAHRYVSDIERLEAGVEQCEDMRAPRPEKLKRQHYDRKMGALERCASDKSTLEVTRRQQENFLERARLQGVPPGWLR